MNSQLLCVLPMLIVILLSIVLKDIFISIFAGVVCGLFLLNMGQPQLMIQQFIEILYDVLMSENTVWVILMCLLFGALIKLIEESGGIEGIKKWINRFCRTRKASLMGMWILGLIICISDYLSVLMVGLTFRKTSDQNKISREMFSYILNSTCVTVCSIMPLSDMAVFMAGLMKSADLIGGDNIMGSYLHVVPFILYSFSAILIVPMFILKIIPLYGPMKSAEEKALGNREMTVDEENLPESRGKIYHFFLPIISVFLFTIWTGDILTAVFISLLASFVLYTAQGIFKVKEFFDLVIKGMLDIFPVCVSIVLAYMLVEINKELGMIDFISQIVLQSVPVCLLPVIIFVGIGIISSISGSFWGMAAIAFPLLGIIVQCSDVNAYLCCGALISAVTFGSQSCLYSDTLMLSSISTEISSVEYFKTSVPLLMIPFSLSALGYTLLGFV